MSYKVNPVKATCMKYADSTHGIQGINNTCFQICADFSGTTDVYNMDPVCTKSCQELVEKRKRELFGTGSCNHQQPYFPVVWDQTGAFFPQLLKQGLNPDQAKNKCMKLCSERYPTLAEECKEKCMDDFNSIESYSPLVQPQPAESPLESTEKKHPWVFWGILGAIILAVIITVYFWRK